MPQICDMGQTALLPFRRKACWGFFRPKKILGRVWTRELGYQRPALDHRSRIWTNGGVTENTKFYEKLLHEELNLPLPRKPDNGTSDLPYVFVGDEALALRKDLLKSFSQNSLLMNVGFLITVCHEPGGSSKIHLGKCHQDSEFFILKSILNWRE
jgi:hypothetical protein